MARFAQDTHGQTIMAFPINETTQELSTASNVKTGDIDTIHCMDDNVLSFLMRSGKTVTINATAGEDFGISEDVVSFSSTASVRVA